MKNAVNNLIKQRYEKELYKDISQMEKTRVSIPMEVADSILFELVANRFGESRSSFLSDLISQLALQTFQSLEPLDRESISIEADSLTHYALKQAHDNYDASGVGKWGALNFRIKSLDDPEFLGKLDDLEDES